MFDIGSRIRMIRKQNNMTMNELAKRINLTQPQLSRIENNINMVQFDTLEKICEVFNISLSEFFKGNDELSPEIQELLQTAKKLTPEQIQQLSNFLKTITKSKRLYP